MSPAAPSSPDLVSAAEQALDLARQAGATQAEAGVSS
jgi:hypothetical protein